MSRIVEFREKWYVELNAISAPANGIAQEIVLYVQFFKEQSL